MIEARDVRMGQLGMSNQVSHHILYMYDSAGQPSKTAKVRELMSRIYSGGEIGQGYAGDEDNGETSAWWLFRAMGFYPLQMGDGSYAVGSPLFTKMTLTMDNGKRLVINTPNNSATNIYVGSGAAKASSAGPLSPDTPETLPPAPVEPMAGPDAPDSVPVGGRILGFSSATCPAAMPVFLDRARTMTMCVPSHDLCEE